ncbi:MAG: Hsp33 family molecular chaperone HslO, partial [Lachnospiraceae bacterium]|nr:Hsp33 family molecular chaperone HslO [Lachnospiraceae bacterium]
GLKEPYVGRTALVSGEIAEDITSYFAVSEQIPSAVALGVLMSRENEVEQAGGFILQLMPFAEEETISALETKLAELSSITSMLNRGMTPEDILQELLGDLGVTIHEQIETEFFCNCDKKRVEKALISIGKKEI